jgi:heat shock protein 5
VYGVKNALKDDKKADKLSDEDKETVEAEVKKAQEWMDENPKATKDEFDEAKQAMEKVVSPIMSKLYQGGKPPGDEGSSGDSGDDSDEL